MNKQFENICRMSQKSLKRFLTRKLYETHGKVITDDGFVYAPGKFPVLLVAHMDTVHKKLPATIIYNRITDSISSPNGIGGDDRCGVYMILKIIKTYNCSVLFCEDEEIGGVGAEKFIKSKHAKDLKFNYIIEFDRKGKNDAVFYDCDNPDFEEFITKEFYKTNYGTFSDISILAPELGCAAVNLSCGYYDAHKLTEYVVLHEMEANIREAKKILERTGDKDVFEYIEADNYYDDYYGEKWFEIDYMDKDGYIVVYDVYAVSEAEAIGKFCMTHPDIPYGDICDVFANVDMYSGWRY